MATREELIARHRPTDALHDDMTPAEMLERCTELALRRGHEILRNPSVDGHTLRAQTSLINTYLTSAIRVQEARLRQRREDALERIQARIEEERRRLLETA